MTLNKPKSKIFINYRRGDDPGFAGRIFDRLNSYFSSDQIFMDVVGIPPGRNFSEEIDRQISQCAVFLCIISEHWLGITDDSGHRRLDSATDFVRVEIELALQHNVLTIPVLVNNAAMPSEAQLPKSLRPLALRNAFRITHDRFDSESAELIKFMGSALNQAGLYPNEYTNLERLLRSKNWKDANKETILLFQKLAHGDFVIIGGTELQAIDRLWVRYSDGMFGFSIQKKIFIETDNNLGEFWRRVAWINRFSIISEKNLDDGLIFSLQAPKGHLPFILDLSRFPVLKAVLTLAIPWLAGATWGVWLEESNEKVKQFKTFLLRQDL